MKEKNRFCVILGFLMQISRVKKELKVTSATKLFLGGAPTSICNFFHPSVRESVVQYISGTVHHLIKIFDTHK